MSPRAACRLETLGFEHVYDYVAGKADWLANGLDVEGTDAGRATVGRLARADVVTCSLDEVVGEVRARVEASPYRFALVVSQGGLLLGRVRRAALEGDPRRTAEEVMESGPSTVRPDTVPAKLAERLRSRDLHTAIVTTPAGILTGVARATTSNKPPQPDRRPKGSNDRQAVASGTHLVSGRHIPPLARSSETVGSGAPALTSTQESALPDRRC